MQENDPQSPHEKRKDNVILGVISLVAAGLFGMVSIITSDAPTETRRAMIEHGPEMITWGFRVAAAGNLVNAGYRFVRVIKGYLA